MLDGEITPIRVFSNANRFIEAYHAVLQPLCRESGLPPMAVDILMFAANNPDYATARNICQYRGMKPSIVSVHVERLVSEISSFQAEEETSRRDLLEKYEKIPEMEYKRIVEIAELIDAAVQYIVHRAVENRNRTMTYEWMLRSASAGMADSRITGLPPDIGKVVDEPETVDSDEPISLARTSPVYPAVSYVESHRGEMVTMRDMANLCHLSPSYFSKIFPREAGETFTDYVNRRKVEWAKQKLRDSAESVSSVAFELGYVDTSYFIKVFKKFEGITPLAYRQQKYK